MKKIYLLFLTTAALLLGSFPVRAQLSGSDSLRLKLTAIFANVDKSQVPTGYLNEAGVRLLEPRYYNGVLSDSNLTDMDVLRYLRLMLSSARVYGTDTLPSLSAYNARLDAATTAGGDAIPVSMHYMQYATIRPDALQNNLLWVQNEQVFDVPGRPQNPYQTQFLFAAAPVSSSSPTNNVSFVLRRNLYLTNSSVPTYAPQIDFGDGRGYQSTTWNQPISTTYATAGRKRVKVKLTFIHSNGTQESWFDFDVLSVATLARGTTGVFDAMESFSGDATHSGGKAFVIFGNTAGIKNTRLTKPFIISEGYNLYDIAKALRKCNNPNNDIEAFFNSIDPRNTGTFNFQTKLLNAGYDIVYIDNARGTDDIVRNARLFEAVVRWVNLSKEGGTATGAKNVVMGQSMGGLVARYGLAEMTKRGNDDPHTRLLVLHDSPQRGAYNPVGVQSLGRSFDVPFLFGYTLADLSSKLTATVRVLKQPATQQLSILNAFNGRGDVRANTFIPSIYQPMITFSVPPPYDVVAVSNGSQCGRGQSTPVGVTLAESSLAFLVPAPFLPIPLTSAAAGVTSEFASYGLPAYGQQAIISRIDLRLEYRINIGRCPFCVSIPIRFRLLRESATSPPNTLPYEILPGGSTNPKQQADNCADDIGFGTLNGIYAAYLRTNLYNGDICFVPSYSALDVPTVTPTTAFAKYLNNTTDNPSPPKVERYIAQEEANSGGTQFNVAHISFTPRNSEWIFNEMQRPVNGNTNTAGCTTECVQPLISGISITGNMPLFCYNETFTLSASGPGAALFTWSGPSGVTFSPAQTGPGQLVTVQMPNGPVGPGDIEVRASGGEGCPAGAPTKLKFVLQRAPLNYATNPVLLQVGSDPGYNSDPAPPQFPDSSPGPVYQPVQCNAYTYLRLYGTLRDYYGNPLTTFRWNVDGQEPANSANQTTILAQLRGGQVCLIVTNKCGEEEYYCWQIPITGECGGGGGPIDPEPCVECRSAPTTAYPNPADTELTVPLPAGARGQVRLFNGQGRAVRQAPAKGSQVVLDVRTLPNGLYYLEVPAVGASTRQQIQVQH